MGRFTVTIIPIALLTCTMAAVAQTKRGPDFVSAPSVPTVSAPAGSLPEYLSDSNAYGLEMARRNEWGFTGPNIQMPPHSNPLVELQQKTAPPDARVSKDFQTPIINVEGYASPASPPDTNGDVGLNRFVQATNEGGYGSLLHVYSKDGTFLQTIVMDTLASGAPCSSGYCDPVILYDEIADRWVATEFASSGSYFCVYVSQTSDPQGSWYAYQFGDLGYGGPPDYPKYGVWPQDDDGDGNYNEGSYLIGVNAGFGSNRDVYALDRGRMLLGQPASYQKFSAPALSGFGFQLLLPAGQEGANPPPNGQPAIFARPVDTELHSGYSCSPEPCDLIDLWALAVDWNTPSNSTFTHLPEVKIHEFDQTLCGTTGNWDCMPQPDTSQKIDPIREPIHFPLQYRNFGDHQTIVGSFVEDTDGTDHAGVHWFELRKTTGDWYAVQDGVIGGESGVHRSVSSAAMDQAGDIAVGYTRTGDNSPYYPSIHYSGRVASDAAGTMPYYDETIWDASTSKTDNERWGDYSGIGVDPSDGCTFWYTTEYGGSGHTRIASFRFSGCLCTTPGVPSGLTATANGNNRIDLSWSAGNPAGDTYNVYRAVGSCPQSSWTLIQSGVSSTSWSDTTVSAGIAYAYSVTSVDTTGNCESAKSNCATSFPCSITFNPTGAGFTETGGSGTITVTADDCDWTAVSNDGWITVTSGSTGHGNGTVGYSVATCSGGGSRSGSISIGDQTFTVNETCGSVGATPVVTSMKRKRRKPFRLTVAGSDFEAGLKVYIDGTLWGSTVDKGKVRLKSAEKLVIKKGGALKALLPKGTPVEFKFVNPGGGWTTHTYTR